MRIFRLKLSTCVSILLGSSILFAFTGTGYTISRKPTISKAAGTKVHLHVTVMGGRKAIVGSTVTIWEIGTTGPNTALPIAATVTDPKGNWNITTVPCVNTDSQLYLTATSGVATGSGPLNPSIGLIAMIGPCNNLPNTVVVNEASTVAAAYAMSQFTTTAFDPNYGVSGSPGSDAYIGINNAARLASQLVFPFSGLPSPLLMTSPNSPAFLNTIADVLVSCVNDVAPFTVCSDLRNTVSPGPGMVPDTTWGVAATIARHPAENVAAVFAFLGRLPAGVPAPFTPTLTSTPNDLAFSVNFVVPGGQIPHSLTIDHAGNVWFSDAGAKAVFELSPIGKVLSPTGGFTAGGKLTSPRDVFFDGTGNGSVWISNTGGNNVFQINTAGSVLTNTNAGPILPRGLATDSFGQLWYANASPGSLEATMTKRTSPTHVVTSLAGLSTASYLTVDTADTSSNIIWATNQQTDNTITVVRVVNNGTATFTGTSTSISTLSTNGAGGISVDNNGDVWAVNTGGGVGKFKAADGSVAVALVAKGGISSTSMPVGVVTDSTNNVWVSNNNNIAELDTDGNALSPTTGFTAGGLFFGSQPGLAVDRSGNVWAASTKSGAIGLVELVGAASPVATPRQGRPTAP